MRLLFFFLLFASLAGLAGAAQITSNYSRQYANTTISRAVTYVNVVNQSSYLIFYPNLTQAYADLNRSMSFYNSSPASAVVFANRAIDEAAAQYNAIGTYREVSSAAMFFITLLLALVLYRLMIPVRVSKQKKRR